MPFLFNNPSNIFPVNETKEREVNPHIWEAGTSSCLAFLLNKGLKWLIDIKTNQLSVVLLPVTNNEKQLWKLVTRDYSVPLPCDELYFDATESLFVALNPTIQTSFCIFARPVVLETPPAHYFHFLLHVHIMNPRITAHHFVFPNQTAVCLRLRFKVEAQRDVSGRGKVSNNYLIGFDIN